VGDRIAAIWHEAYENGATLALLREFLRLDPSQGHARRHGTTLLHLAVNQRVHEGVALLLAGGADVNGVDDCGETPLHIAAWNLDPEGCLQLLEAGADPHARDARGRTPLEVAVNGTIQAPAADSAETRQLLKRAVGVFPGSGVPIRVASGDGA
jgi:hypothetical protein